MPPPAFIPAHGAPPVRPPAEAQQAPPPQQSTSGLPVKEWEGALRLDVPTTAINPLPIDEFDEREDPTFGGKLPPMTDLEKNEVKTWLAKDIKFATGIIDQRKKTHLRMQAWSEVEERQTQWWMMRKGEARPRVPKHVNIIYPADKALQRLKARKRKEIRFTPKQYKSMAEIEDHIVPVRLELEHEHNRFSDTFLWNCSGELKRARMLLTADTVVTPELFAQSICDDFKLPAGQFVPKIVAAIKERVREYQDQVMPLQSDKKPELSGRGVIDEDDPETCTMMELFRQAHEADEMDEIRTDEGADQDDSHIRIVSFDDEVLDDKVMTVDEAMACLAPPAENDELRILIKIDIIVGTQNLVDTFEWDLNSKVTAEEFAQSYCIDLGLCGEFVTAIAHDIHEQVVTHQRSLFIVGHTQNSGYINNDDLRSAFLPPLTVALRKEDVAMATFTPVLATFTEQDVIAIEKERERESKRKKRGTRGRRGIVLPDREPPKTFRTQLHPLIDPAVIAAADPAPPPMSSTRRAAAIAAQANINLALNETQPFLAPSPPPAATHTGRGRGRWPRGGRGGGMSRASPSSTREGSVVNGDHTPTIGFKRSLREDSEPGLASPLPPRKRHNGRIADSPEADEQLDKRPDDTLGAPVPPVAPVRAPSPPKQWHCKNCGVPEHLSGGKREMDLCAKCSDYLQRTGQRRPAQYNEDEEYHRLRNDSDSPKPPAFEMPITPVVASPSRKRVSNRFDEDSDSDSSSSSDEDEDDEHMRKKAKTAAAKPGASPSLGAPVTPKVTSSSALPVTPQPHNAPTPPDWTSRAHAIMQAKYPDHRFGIVLKSRPADAASGTPNEWRVKCHDCPGRLYNPGPDETLNNFEVHLKNRQHRERVEARVAAKRK
jgi:SWI/SNF-related matrix-associated actin-dependent regulator of chromatin subfamily B protein 1